MKITRKLGLLGVACGLVVAACGSDKKSVESTPTSVQAAQTTAATTVTTEAAGTSAPGSTTDQGPATGSEIVIGNVSAFTGPISENSAGPGIGMQVWVKYINDHGGVAGHRIRLVTGDSKSDPTQEGAAFQQIVESDHPVAFVGYGAINPANPKAYVEAEKMPIIGGQIADDLWDSSPVYYSMGTSNKVVYYALAKSSPSTKLGVMYCTESPSCDQAATNFKSAADLIGSKVLFSQQLSIAAPDFTAACLAAKSAGVESMLLIFDTPNNLRFAESCARQGFKPTYLWHPLLPHDDTASKPGMDGAIAVQSILPWWLTDGAGATFHEAMAKYAPDQAVTSGVMMGWVSGELFRKAAEAALAKGGDELTTDALVGALNSINDETLGGLTGPLSFAADHKVLHYCWFAGISKDGKWTGGEKYQCVPDADRAKL